MGELLGNLGINGKLLIAQVVNFLLVFWLLQRFVFGKLLTFIENRKKEITRGLELKAQAQREVERTKVLREETLEQARTQAQETLQEAKTTSEQMVRATEKKAKGAAEEIVLSAKEQAEKERQLALRRLQQEVGEAAFAAAEKILRRTITKKDQERLLKEALESAKQEYAARN